MDTQKLLKDHSLRQTESRMDVLNFFSSTGHALSHADIEQSLQGYDRVTIYRTLTTFEEKGIIHKVLDDSGSAKYALCADGCHEHDHADNHIHFKCSICDVTQCIDDLAIPAIQLPQGFKAEEMNLLVLGVCNACNKVA